MILAQIQSTVAADFRRNDGVSRKNDEKYESSSAKRAVADRTSLSSEARQAGANAAAMRVLTQRVEAQPEIRQDRIEATRQRVENGFYNSEEFASNLADRLISQFGS